MVSDLSFGGEVRAVRSDVTELVKRVCSIEERLLVVERCLDLLQSAVDSHVSCHRED